MRPNTPKLARGGERRTSWSFALVLALALAPASLGAQQAPADESVPESLSTALAELARAGQPTEDHALLDPLAGSWSVEARWSLPGMLGAPLTGRSDNTWILGDRFLRCDAWVGEGPQRVEATTLYGFDRGTERFTAIGAADIATSLFETRGHYDADTRSFVLSGEFRNPVTAAVTTYRERIAIEGPDRYTLELYYDPRGALPYRLLIATFTRLEPGDGGDGAQR